jgi:acetylornithine deacetylase
MGASGPLLAWLTVLDSAGTGRRMLMGMIDMEDRVNSAVAILDRLVAFESLPGQSNLDLVAFVRDYLADNEVESFLSLDESGSRANLHAWVGPSVDGGVVLNGHTDVVPVDGQAWTSDPFQLTRRDGRLYGRGTVDMKGFLACMLAAVPTFQAHPLTRPVHLTCCYDEEIGGLGAPHLVTQITTQGGPRPAIAIVGEPTEFRIVSGHKGGFEMRTEIVGLSGHASDPRKGVSAIFFAGRFVARLEEMAAQLAIEARENSEFDPPYSTINVGTFRGGTARNVIAGHCIIDWELRPIPGEDGRAILAEIDRFARDELLPEMRALAPQASIFTTEEAVVPALDPADGTEAVALISEITGINSTECASFATDAGHFCHGGISTAVYGPGSIKRAHRPDEFIEERELAACLAFLDNLAYRLSR